MLDLKEIEKEIEEHEAANRLTREVCEELAWLYILHDHMKCDKTRKATYTETAHESYSTSGWEHSAHEVEPFTREMAMEWACHMENEDGTMGPHWSMEQVKNVMGRREIKCDPIEFFAALNMMYSDYCAVFRKYGVGDKLDFYIDMAVAFLDDKDAKDDKLARYYEFVVER